MNFSDLYATFPNSKSVCKQKIKEISNLIRERDSLINEYCISENDCVSAWNKMLIQKEYIDSFWAEGYIPHCVYYENGIVRQQFLPLDFLDKRLQWLKSYLRFIDIRKSGISDKEISIPFAKQIPITSLYEGSNRKSGKYVVDKCPLHKEKTASFFVNTDKNTFRCFGCGKYGDSIDFIMIKEGLAFKDAVNFLMRSKNGKTNNEVRRSKE